MLQDKVLKEKYKIIDKKVYAVFEETNERREVDGCEVRVELAEERDYLEQHKKWLDEELKKIDLKLTANIRLDSELSALGYCKKNNPVYTKVDGLVVKDFSGNPVVANYTHQANCVNKGE